MSKETKSLEQWQLEDAARLKALFDRRTSKISQAEFGEKFGIGSQGMVWQYLAGRRPLNIEAAAAFAGGLEVGIDEFSPTIAERVREAARFAAPTSGGIESTLQTQAPRWMSAEAFRLLNLYFGADEEARAEIMATAVEARRATLPLAANHQA